jgi:hypothetical protein
MSTFTGLRISRFFLSLRTSALFPFYVLTPGGVFPSKFPPAIVINLEQKLCRLKSFQQISAIICLCCILSGILLDKWLSVKSCNHLALTAIMIDKEVSQGVDGVVV